MQETVFRPTDVKPVKVALVNTSRTQLGTSLDGTKGDLTVVGSNQEVKMLEGCEAAGWRFPLCIPAST